MRFILPAGIVAFVGMAAFLGICAFEAFPAFAAARPTAISGVLNFKDAPEVDLDFIGIFLRKTRLQCRTHTAQPDVDRQNISGSIAARAG